MPGIIMAAAAGLPIDIAEAAAAGLKAPAPNPGMPPGNGNAGVCMEPSSTLGPAPLGRTRLPPCRLFWLPLLCCTPFTCTSSTFCLDNWQRMRLHAAPPTPNNMEGGCSPHARLSRNRMYAAQVRIVHSSKQGVLVWARAFSK